MEIKIEQKEIITASRVELEQQVALRWYALRILLKIN